MRFPILSQPALGKDFAIRFTLDLAGTLDRPLFDRRWWCEFPRSGIAGRFQNPQ